MPCGALPDFVSILVYVDITMSQSLTRAENDSAAYTLCLGSHRKFMITACLLKFSKSIIKIMYIQRIEKNNTLIKNTLRALFA